MPNTKFEVSLLGKTPDEVQARSWQFSAWRSFSFKGARRPHVEITSSPKKAASEPLATSEIRICIQFTPGFFEGLPLA